MTIFFHAQRVAATITELSAKHGLNLWQDLQSLPKDLPGWPNGLASRLHQDGVIRPIGKVKNRANCRTVWDKGTNYKKLMRYV